MYIIIYSNICAGKHCPIQQLKEPWIKLYVSISSLGVHTVDRVRMHGHPMSSIGHSCNDDIFRSCFFLNNFCEKTLEIWNAGSLHWETSCPSGSDVSWPRSPVHFHLQSHVGRSSAAVVGYFLIHPRLWTTSVWGEILFVAHSIHQHSVFETV